MHTATSFLPPASKLPLIFLLCLPLLSPPQAVCQAIAVLLHYFFLVTFMWMLMEGVVLYVALVRVFIKKQKRYIIAFTAFSYGEGEGGC